MSSEEPPGTLVRMMAEQEKELGAIRQRIAALKASGSTLDLEARRLEKEAGSGSRTSRACCSATPRKHARYSRLCWWGRWCGRPSKPKKDAGTRFEESSIRLAFYLEEVTPLSMASPTGHALL